VEQIATDFLDNEAVRKLSEQPITRNNQPRMAGMGRTGDNY